MDSNRKLLFAVLCVAAAFLLVWYGKEGGVAFLTLIGGSPLGNHIGESLTGYSAAASSDATVTAAIAENGEKGS